MVGGLPDWMRLWCVMRQSRLRCWKNPEDVGRRLPEHVIELTEVNHSVRSHGVYNPDTMGAVRITLVSLNCYTTLLHFDL